MMKKTLTIIMLLTSIPLAAQAQWSANLNLGWVGNASPDWTQDFGDRPFSLWGGGLQYGISFERRSRDWLAWGMAASYQSFKSEPSGSAVDDGRTIAWSGQGSWQVPVALYVRLIRPRAIMGTNLKLGLGSMASHLGRLEVSEDGAPVKVLAGTGETAYRPFGQIGAGIRLPVTARFGITVDYGYLSTFDRTVAEMPLVVGLEIDW